jgi:tetratricopeptide (TPR) repeat protein
VAGSIIEAGGRIRIDMKLIDRQGQVVWADEVTRDASEVLPAQADVARLVATHLALQLSPAEQEGLNTQQIQPAAQEAHLRGLAAAASRAESQIPEAARYFREAITIEPDFAPAWAELALIELRLAEFADPLNRTDRVSRAKEMATQALKLDARVTAAHVALGIADFYYDWDFDAAERSFRRALDVAPSNPDGRIHLAWLLAARGRVDEAVGLGEEALRREPFVPARLITLGTLYYYRRDYARATELMNRSLQLAPDHPVARFGLGRIHAAKGEYEDAAAQIRLALDRSRNMAWLPELACVLAAVGRNSGVESVLKELAERESRGETYSLDHRAHIAAAEGRLDEGFSILREAVERRVTNVLWMAVDPRLDPYRADPRFPELLRLAHLRQ